MRMTENKRRVLDALGLVDDDTNLQWGAPPRSAATVAGITGSPDVSNTARTLRSLENQKLAISEIREVDQWCEVPKPGHYPRKTKCYWRAETIEQDKAAAEKWEAGSKERSERALDKLMRL